MSRLLPLLLLLLALPARASGLDEPLDAAIRGQQLGLLLVAGGGAALLSGAVVVDTAPQPVPGADYSHPAEQLPAVPPQAAVGGTLVGLGAVAMLTGAVNLGVYGLDGASALRARGQSTPRWAGRTALGLMIAAPVGYLATRVAAPTMDESSRRELALGTFGAGAALGTMQLGINLLGRHRLERSVQLQAQGAGLALSGSW